MATVDCMGESFEVWPEISAWAFNDFAQATKAIDGDLVGVESVLAMMALLKDCVVPEDWTRFETVTRAKRAGFEDLMKVVKDMVEGRAERPTGRLSDSSDGPTSIEPKSESSSAVKVSEMFPGRPDLQLAVLRAQGVA